MALGTGYTPPAFVRALKLIEPMKLYKYHAHPLSSLFFGKSLRYSPDFFTLRRFNFDIYVIT